jgi:hypothetical protein
LTLPKIFRAPFSADKVLLGLIIKSPQFIG